MNKISFKIQDKIMFYTVLILAISGLLMIPNDAMFYNKGNTVYYSYFVGRIAFLALCGFLAFKSLKSKLNENYYSLLYAGGMFYTIHGQYFRPGYFLSYIEFIFFISFCFNIPRKNFIFLTIFSFICFLLVSNYGIGYSLYSAELFKADMMFGTITCTILSFFVHSSFTTQEFEQKKLYVKYYSLGKYASSIIHDLKGLIHSPLNYSQMMDYHLKNNSEKEEMELIIKQQSLDLENLSKMVSSMSDFLSNEHKSIEAVNIKDTINECLFVSRTEKFNVIHNNTDIFIKTNKAILKKILFNIIKNTTDAVKNKEDHQIIISFDNNTLTVSDNGSGFPANVLKNIQANSFSQMKSSKENGSGFGLFIIKELATQINSRVSFFNKNGANVKITFP